MAHQRFLKAEYFTDWDVAQMPALYRIFFQGLWCQADRNGTLEDKPAQLKVRVMPYDDVDAVAVIDELLRRRFLVRFRAADGLTYLAIRTWKKNQSINKNEKHSGLPSAADEGSVLLPFYVNDSCPTAARQLNDSLPSAERQLSSFPVPVPVPSPVPVPGPGAPAAPPTAPRFEPGELGEEIAREFKRVTGEDFEWTAEEEQALRGCLRKAKGDGAKLLAYWGRCLRRVRYPIGRSLQDLNKHWNHYAADEPGAKPKGLTSNTTDAEFLEKTRHLEVDENGDLVL